jgi:hypothetical protein
VEECLCVLLWLNYLLLGITSLCQYLWDEGSASMRSILLRHSVFSRSAMTRSSKSFYRTLTVNVFGMSVLPYSRTSDQGDSGAADNNRTCSQASGKLTRDQIGGEKS